MAAPKVAVACWAMKIGCPYNGFKWQGKIDSMVYIRSRKAPQNVQENAEFCGIRGVKSVNLQAYSNPIAKPYQTLVMTINVLVPVRREPSGLLGWGRPPKYPCIQWVEIKRKVFLP